MSTKTWCCNGRGKPKSAYLSLFEKGSLNPGQLDPRLETVGVTYEQNRFIPDRRGVSHIHTTCEGKGTGTVQQCIRNIAKFIRKHKCNPLRITCRVNYLETLKMHWHIHYERKDWIKIIEEEDGMNIYAEDIADKEGFMKIIEMVDVFKHCYAQNGWDIHHQKIVDLNIGRQDNVKDKKDDKQKDDDDKQQDEDSNAKPMSAEDRDLAEAVKKTTQKDEIKEIKNRIKSGGYNVSNMECRIWKKMVTQKNGKISLEAEISSAVKIALNLKHICNNNLFFKDMRFGLDFESKSSFVEIRPRAFFLLFDGKLKTFMKKFRSVAKTRFMTTEKKLVKSYGEKRVQQLKKYAESYFEKNPDLFEWHQNRH